MNSTLLIRWKRKKTELQGRKNSFCIALRKVESGIRRRKESFVLEIQFCSLHLFPCKKKKKNRSCRIPSTDRFFFPFSLFLQGFYAGQARSIDRPRDKRKNSERSRSVIRNWAETTPRLIQKFALLRVITKRVSTRYPALLS